MLSFNIVNDGRGIEISCDSYGMNVLIDALEKIRITSGHVHLCTPANGGHELSEKTSHGDEAVGEVIINWLDEVPE